MRMSFGVGGNRMWDAQPPGWHLSRFQLVIHTTDEEGPGTARDSRLGEPDRIQRGDRSVNVTKCSRR
jgi:hypothetical protein